MMRHTQEVKVEETKKDVMVITGRQRTRFVSSRIPQMLYREE
jgi:hypothetical protein